MLRRGRPVGLGSDHTDRKAETVGVSLSKQMCAKPVSHEICGIADVAPHWDEPVLRSYIGRRGRAPPLSGRRGGSDAPAGRTFPAYANGEHLPAGTAMFCGTLAVHGGITPAQTFEMELEDPVLRRKITHGYSIQTLPDQG